MKAFWQALSVRDQALLIALQLFDRKHCDELLSLLSAHQQTLLSTKAELLSQLKRKSRVTLLVSRLRELCASDDIFQLIHEGWIVEALNKEQPIIAATIMQTFSARLLERVMMHADPSLNPQTIMLFTNASQRLSCPRVGGNNRREASASFVSSFFAQQWKNVFSSMRSMDDNSILSLEPNHMYKFLHLIGSLEVAGFLTALGIRKAATYISFFPMHERVEIIKALQSYSAQPQRMWSKHEQDSVFSKSESVEHLFYNAALYALACAFQKEDFEVAQIIAFKLPLDLGNNFLEIVQGKMDSFLDNNDFQEYLNRTAHDVIALNQLERGVII